MKTLICSMGLNGEYSITLASLRYISDTHKEDAFEELIMPKNGVLTEAMLAKFKDADMLNEKYRADVYAWYQNARSLRRSGVFALPPDRYFVFGAYSYCFLAGYPV